MAALRIGAVLAVLALCGPAALAVDRSVFKTCEQSSFCRRSRSLKPGTSTFRVATTSAPTTTATSASMDLVNGADRTFVLTVQALQSSTFRVQIDEKAPLHQRYRIEDALKADPQTAPLTVTGGDTAVVTLTAGANRVVITKEPLRLDFYANDVLSVTANGKGLMRFEHYRERP